MVQAGRRAASRREAAHARSGSPIRYRPISNEVHSGLRGPRDFAGRPRFFAARLFPRATGLEVSMDVLSQALCAVRMTGAIFINAEFSAPWGFESPPARRLAPVLAPGAERLIVYHLVTEGEASARMGGMPPLSLAAGDVVIIPHGHPHTAGCASSRNRHGEGALRRR